jgi:hypothetical protein
VSVLEQQFIHILARTIRWGAGILSLLAILRWIYIGRASWKQNRLTARHPLRDIPRIQVKRDLYRFTPMCHHRLRIRRPVESVVLEIEACGKRYGNARH